MDAKLVSNYLTALKEKTGLTFETVAEKSGRSESTVKNLFSGRTEDPRLDTVAPVIYALGGSLDEMYTGKSKDKVKESSIYSMKDMYEFQLAEQAKLHEANIAEIRAHYQQHRQDSVDNYERRLADKREIIKEKDEHIKMLKKEKSVAFLCAILGISVLVIILIAEVMNPELGWIQF